MATRKVKQIGPSAPRPTTRSTGPPSEPYGSPWPAEDFEASPYSPAGELLGLSRFAHGVKNASGRRRIVGTVLVVVFVAPLIIGSLWTAISFAIHQF